MSEVYTYNATHLVLVRDGEAEFTQSAEFGNVGNGRLGIDDTAGTLSIVGQKDFLHTESACSFTRTFRGFIADRTYGRDSGVERKPHVGAGRGIDVQLEDLNSMLGHRMLRDHNTTAAQNGKRPAESVGERLEWLMSNHAMNLIDDNGRVDYVTSKDMDKADYRKQFPGDVLADCATAAGGYNYYVRDFGSGPELVFRDDNASTDDTSTLRISNVLSDASSVTLHPYKDATLRRDPGRLRSVISYDHAKGSVTVERDATATAFNGERAGNASNSNIKTDAKARRDAERMLFQLSTEEDILECTVRVTAAQVNLLMQGDRVQVKFSHLATEGYGSFTWCRVLERTVKPVNAEAADYEIRVKLSPQEPAEPASTVAIVQSVFTRSSEGGINLELPNAVTVGNLLVYVAADRGSANPSSPNYLNSDQFRFGSDPWTKLPNTTNVNDYGDGVAIWYKTADTAENVGWIPSSHTNMGLYEISGQTVTGATTLDETLQANALTMSLGSLGTAGTDQIAVAVILWSDQRMWGAPMPGVAPLAPFVTDHFDSNYEGGAITENSPFVWIGHAFGTGAALTPSITRTDAAQLSGIWAGVALLLEP